MDNENGTSTHRKEEIQHPFSPRAVEQTAAATFSGYEVSFRTLALIYVGILSSLFMTLMESTVVSTSVVTITDELGGYFKSSWLFTSYMLTFSGFAIIWAKASDIFGRKACLLASLLTFLAFSAACGASTTLIQLIMIRWLQGIGAAGVFSLTLVFYELIPPTKYALSASVTNIIVSLSFLTGPLIGGAITKNGQWKWVFWVNLPVMAVSGILLFVVFPPRLSREPVASRSENESLAQRLKRFDVLGGIMLLGVTVPLLTALQQASQGISFGSSLVWPLLLVTSLFLVSFLAWQWYVMMRRSFPEPVLPWRFLTHRASVGIMLNAFFSGCVMTVCIVQIPQRFIVLYNMSPLSAGARLLPFSLMVPVGSVVSAVLLDRKIVSINLLLCVGGALQTVGVALFANLSSSAGNLGRQYGFQIIIGIGLGCVSTATFLLVPIKLEKRDLAVGTGMVAQFRILGGVVSLAIVTCVANPAIRQSLLGLVTPEEANAILEKFATVRYLPVETQERVRASFRQGFDLQMKIVVGFAAAHIPSTLLMMSKDWFFRHEDSPPEQHRHN